ncbi:F-box/kelch-repeat protein At3g23880-like [Gastrolobium bilobum]|uniref:F-box/kelch-repeat protein At3g23880-like n=1 Tax=Gastrolobium bilobum TaxID=150636 RepID=UPI002AAF6053|nr:F-box/kelch-repeat protein At3g23880-like [Gastrolobium bilobum]
MYPSSNVSNLNPNSRLKNRNMKRRSMESNLHWDVIHEILLRLPVKSLVRFKSVCKSWHSLISDPHFANSHYELSAAPSHKLLHIASVSEARSIDAYASLNDDSSVRAFPYRKMSKEKPAAETPLLIERGFHRELSYFEILEESQYEKIYLTGFGYDSSTDDYLIIIVLRRDGDI